LSSLIRGILSIKNIKEIENSKFHYIITTKRRKIPKFLKELFTRPNYSKIRKDNQTYVLILNEERRKEELQRIESLFEKIKSQLRKNKDAISLAQKFGKASKFIDFKEMKINEKVYEYEKLIAGKYILVTSTDFKPEELEERYKGLREIERFFREIKSFVKVRPIWHRKTENIVAHVFICSFALFVKRLLEEIQKGTLETLKNIKAAIIETEIGNFFFLNQAYQKNYPLIKGLNLALPSRVIPVSLLD